MFALIYITTSSKEESIFIGKKLVEERLAACSNIIPKIKSFYWWAEKLEEDSESILMLKTTSKNINKIITRTKELHSYENPCIVAFPIIAGSGEYFNWLKKEVDTDPLNNSYSNK
ncbi:divalent-cation tolerance protein CutA [Methanobacterium alcaliphilum]|uniref:divalent-cation tolerance protein CutA n=1 Tax=Methanobacterium alcaliphilum TaxID=392018 RepID=UPI00200AA95B|nr:divalent-cation tolerance protein CutA [Methanobacterium alcaliphilum]MCK9152332.1 divalent-cation tolerance protein CutA [Methanobacterium alcaliphilum]